MRFEWDDPEFSLEKSTLAFFTLDGEKMVGYQELYDATTIPVRPRMWGHVHPDYMGRGIGTYLFQWAEKLAHRVFDRVPEDARVVFTAGRNSKNPDSHELLVANGFLPTGQAWQKMLIDLTDEEPHNPPAPEGFRWVTMAEFNDTRKAYAAHRDAFHDHRGFVAEDFEVMYNPDEGYVANLGVTPAYRQRGFGKAALYKAFNALWNRGKRKVSLYVDGSSLTGANRLYMGAGMRIAESYESYEKEMRAGKEYSKQD